MVSAGASIDSAALAQSGGQSGQTNPREVLLGVARLRPAAEAEPDAVYATAARLLRDGETASAQRQLEQLVARFPDSGAANRARQDLAALYAPQRVASAPAAAVLPSGPQAMSHLGAPVESPPVIGAWRTSVRPAAGAIKSAQASLREAAGDLVFFAEGSAELGARARKALAAQAEWLVRHGDRSITVEGHADEPGGTEELKALAERRADVVRGRLIEEGVAAERVRIVTYGSERRVALCADESCAGQNRRAVTLVGGPPVVEAAKRSGIAPPR